MKRLRGVSAFLSSLETPLSILPMLSYGNDGNTDAMIELYIEDQRPNLATVNMDAIKFEWMVSFVRNFSLAEICRSWFERSASSVWNFSKRKLFFLCRFERLASSFESFPVPFERLQHPFESFPWPFKRYFRQFWTAGTSVFSFGPIVSRSLAVRFESLTDIR